MAALSTSGSTLPWSPGEAGGAATAVGFVVDGLTTPGGGYPLLVTVVPDLVYRWPRERYDRAVDAGVLDDARVELLDGEIVRMPPQSHPHAASTRWLRTALVRGLDPVRWIVGSHEPVVLSDWSEPEPDVWLARAADTPTGAHPATPAVVLLVEVSWTSQFVDRRRKLPLYAAAGVPEYWIVDLHRGVVDVHRFPIVERYEQVTRVARGDRLTVPEAGLVLAVTDLLDG